MSMPSPPPVAETPSARPHDFLCTVFLLAFFLLPLRAVAQDDLKSFSDKVEVRRVEVEVLVTRSDGSPVHGLGIDDFELLIDKQLVPLSHFVPPAVSDPELLKAREEAEPQARRTEQHPNHLVLFLDLAYLRAGELRSLATPIEEFLAPRLAVGDLVTLVTSDHGLDPLRALEAPLPPLQPIFDGVADRLGRGERLRREYDDIRRDLARTLDSSEFDPLLDHQPNRDLPQLMARIADFSKSARREAETTSALLRLLTSAMAGQPGRKTVLYLGGRLPLDAGRTLAEAWQRASGPATDRRLAIYETNDPDNLNNNISISAQEATRFSNVPPLELPKAGTARFLALAEQASSQGVTFYTFDASRGGADADLGITQGTDNLDAVAGGTWELSDTLGAGSFGALAVLAEGTGGRSLSGRRDLKNLLGALRNHLSGGYLLGFEPPIETEEAEKEASPHRIAVRLRGGRETADLRLQYRRFFHRLPPDLETAERTLSALLLHPSGFAPTNPLEVELEFGARQQGDNGKERLPVTVRVPFSRLALQTETWAHSGQLSFFFTAGSLEHGALPVRKAMVPVRVPNEQLLEAFGRQIESSFEIELPAGARAIAVSVLDDFAPTLSTLVTPLSLPAPLDSAVEP